MTNKIAIWLLGLIVAFFVLDRFVLGIGAGLFLLRELVALIEYLAIWR
tara:strand:- start:77 stop:220 length:144 start_codon:yes stop_codon:yes gene_type:complete